MQYWINTNLLYRKITGDNGQIGVALQALIDKLVSDRLIVLSDLEKLIHTKLQSLPPSAFIDRITGEKKFGW